MRTKLLYMGVVVAATLCLAPAALPAAPRASRPAAVHSSEGSFPITASHLLRQIRMDASSVQDNVDKIQLHAGAPGEMDWVTAGFLLSQVRDQVNDMDKLLFQLRENQAEASPWEQKEIKRIVPTVTILTDTTQAAIVSLSNNQGQPYLSDLPALVRDIDNRASQLDQTLRIHGNS